MIIDMIHADVLMALCVCWLVTMNWLWARYENNCDEPGSECECEANSWQIAELKRNVRDSKGRFIKWGNEQ
jgi:hypothetical protein